jgi:hypothetical protein
VIKLKLVGASTDLEHLVFRTAKGGRRGSHVTEIDDKLFRVLEDVVRKRRAKEKGQPPPPKKPAAEPKLAPREVQRLLRSGRTVESVARSAGMDVSWVERFLGPVLDERTIAIQGSQRARLEKPRLGMSGLPLGDSVARNLRARRVKITDAELADAWDASRVDNQPWVITLTFPYRGRDQKATWRYDPYARELSSVNRLASDVGWVPDGRRPAAAPRAARATTARPKKAAKKRATRASKTKKRATKAKKRTTTKRPATKRRVATKRPAARRATRRPARTTRRATRSTRRPTARRRSRR